jgi:ATPase subunit of ABC transporter with duplicated ATPase domains
MICNKIVEIEDQQIQVYHGNYETYKTEKQARYAKQMQAHEDYQKEKKKREAWMAEMRKRASTYINPAL